MRSLDHGDASADDDILVTLRSAAQTARPVVVQSTDAVPSSLSWAREWCHRVVVAVVQTASSNLEKLAVAAYKACITPPLPADTGKGYLIADKPIWRLSSVLA